MSNSVDSSSFEAVHSRLSILTILNTGFHFPFELANIISIEVAENIEVYCPIYTFKKKGIIKKTMTI